MTSSSEDFPTSDALNRHDKTGGDRSPARVLGDARLAAGDAPAALEYYRMAIAADDACPDLLYAAGVAEHRCGDLAAARSFWRRALVLRPDHPDAAINATLAAMQAGDWAEAEEIAAAAIAAGVPDVRLLLWRGHALAKQFREVEAATAYRAAVAADPASVEAWFALGLGLRDLGAHDAARTSFAQVLKLAPEHVEAAFEAAQLDLMAGRWQAGFALWPARLRRRTTLLPEAMEGEAWDGAPLAGTLVLQAEQGIGDCLQFLRYAGLAAERVGRLVLRVHPPLLRLLNRSDFPWMAVPFGEAVAADAHAPLLDLPRLLECADPCAGRAAWLAAEPWRRRDNRVGLVWSGNPAHHNDGRRSAGFGPFRELKRVAGVSFCHFQWGGAAEAAADWPELVDATAEAIDFADTALQMAKCDLIVSVDTAAAHLAGALGVPAWVLVPDIPDWRWGGSGDATPWYPRASVWRQASRGGWNELLDRVAEALIEWRA
jgi:Flp pilus assembly protein TadD